MCQKNFKLRGEEGSRLASRISLQLTEPLLELVGKLLTFKLEISLSSKDVVG